MYSSSDGQLWGDSINQQQQHLYDVITGKYKYISQPWQPEDLEPDLILTMKVPGQKNIELSQFLSLSTYITNPSPALSRAFQRAEKQILSLMTKNRQNQADTSIKIRFQSALRSCSMMVNTAVYVDQNQQESSFELECVHEKGPILDTFTLQYNAIVYTLQKICGFRVRSFLLYDDDGSNQRIFLFLNLSVENRIKMAARYKMKKEIDYSQIDFFINDPTGKDSRPLKVHSQQRQYRNVLTFYKQLSRFFCITDPHLSQTSVTDQSPLNYDIEDRFLLETEDLMNLIEYYKEMKEPILNSHEKQYIFTYNNRKINRGCKLIYHKTQQRKEYFEVAKYLSNYYGFTSTQQPQIFEEFFIPGKGFVGAGYFQRIKAILNYKPQVVGPDGNLDLFLKMEKIKLAYVLLKSTFKMNFLEKMGFDTVALSDDFELKGTGGNEGVRGGVDGENVKDCWPIYSYFAEINVIRNYFGNLVGHEISFKIYTIYFMSAILVPYLLIYILENIFTSKIYLETDFVKLALMAITFQVYLTVWNKFEEEYVQNFSDQIPSKVFSSLYRGPYVRNMVTDQLNEYQQENMAWKLVKNIICFIIIAALLVTVGGIFYGCRMLLVRIYPSLASLVASFFSVPHLLAYLLFFLIVDMFRYLATDRVINLMVLLQNPASDQDSRWYFHHFRFFYLLGIELIAPIFLLIIEPFSGTSCYSKNCINEIIFYVYARYQIKLGQVLIRFAMLVYHKSKNQLLGLLNEKSEVLTFQSRIQKMLLDAVKELEKENHQNNNTFDIIAVIGFAIYSIMLPLVVLISLFSLHIDAFNTRSYLLLTQRRTINKSQNILTFKPHLNIIYFTAVLINAWIIVFPFNVLTSYFTGIISGMAPLPTKNSVFFVNLTWVAIFFAISVLLGFIAGEITKAALGSWLHARKKNKFREHLSLGHSLKVKPLQIPIRMPLKSVFRTFNPEKTTVEQYRDMIVDKTNFMRGLELSEEADTFSALARRRA